MDIRSTTQSEWDYVVYNYVYGVLYCVVSFAIACSSHVGNLICLGCFSLTCGLFWGVTIVYMQLLARA